MYLRSIALGLTTQRPQKALCLGNSESTYVDDENALAACCDRFYIDDVLTTHEMEVICGVYYVYTGKTNLNLYFVDKLTLFFQDRVHK